MAVFRNTSWRRCALLSLLAAGWLALAGSALPQEATPLPPVENDFQVSTWREFSEQAKQEPDGGAAPATDEMPPDARLVPLDGASGELDELNYTAQAMPTGLIYRAYLAGEKESRLSSRWNREKDRGSVWDITLGGHAGLFRYGTSGNVRPEGFQLDIEGAGLVRLDPEEDQDVDAVDFRFGVPLTWGTAAHQTKVAYYHLSSHLGDEFLLKNPGYPRLNYSRDVFVWGESFQLTDVLRVYAEAGWAFYSDVCEPWEFQFGMDRAPVGPTGVHGAPFWAFNAHLRQEVNFGGNFVGQFGWAWRRSPASGLFRLGIEYYNGQSDQFSFYNQSEDKVGFALWYDF